MTDAPPRPPALAAQETPLGAFKPGGVPVKVTRSDVLPADSVDLIVQAIDAASARLKGKDRELMQQRLAEARMLVVKQLEWDVSRDALMEALTNVQAESIVLRAEVESIHKQIAERQADVKAREASVGALESHLKADVSRVVALEAREATVTQREKLLDAKEAHLARIESEAAAVLKRNNELNVHFESFNQSLIKRLAEAEAWKRQLDEREQTLAKREKALDQWKLDLADRESEHAAKLQERIDLAKQKDALLAEMATIREQRLAEIDAKRRQLEARDAELAKREKEAQALGRALSERNIKLAQRKEDLDAYEARLGLRDAELKKLHDALAARERDVEALRQQVSVLEASRAELLKSLAKIRGEI